MLIGQIFNFLPHIEDETPFSVDNFPVLYRNGRKYPVVSLFRLISAKHKLGKPLNVLCHYLQAANNGGLGFSSDLKLIKAFSEHFNIPAPDALVFISWFAGGEVFRSGCCYNRGRGKVFYFRPGHETFPVYYQPEIQKVIRNAVRWAAPVSGPSPVYGNTAPLEKISASV